MPATPYLSARCFYANRFIWILIALSTAFNAAWMYKERINIDVSQALIFFPVFAVCFLISLIYRYVRRDDRLFLLGNVTNQLLGSAAVLGVMSYLTARCNLPLVDEQLIAIDHWLHFDWKEFVFWLDGIPLLARILSLSYATSGPQILALMFLLFFYKELAHVQRFIITFLTCGLLVIFFATLFPAMGGYIYYHVNPAQFAHITPVAGSIHAQSLMEMRDHSVNMLAFPLKGLVTFPSFHSSLAILLIYASLPIRWAFNIVLPLNLLVLLSTPADGGHYLTDIIGGVVLAFVSIAIAQRILPRF